ncbi:MAG: hypothetical protein B7Z83_02975 [Thiomonas sp. 20-64-5]|nr:MAG: hypothetical protein B7Z83_02975 [Thiomonas sp. 20-64-5]
MFAILSILRTAWFSMLMLLLGLMPFIHGHLGQPVQNGWHIHALSAAAEVRASPQFDGLACLANNHRHAAQQTGLALHAPEPSDIELAAGIAQSRLPQIRLAHAFVAQDGIPAALAFILAFASQSSSAALTATHWPQTPDSALPRVHHGLPPPGQPPPSILA